MPIKINSIDVELPEMYLDQNHYLENADGTLRKASLMERGAALEVPGTTFVAYTQFSETQAIRTYFMGLNFNFDPNGPLHIYQTDIMGLKKFIENECARYSTREEAMYAHNQFVETVNGHARGMTPIKDYRSYTDIPQEG